jgi:ketosteroid isomerase-like protein
MHRCVWVIGLVAMTAACGPSVNLDQERETLLRLDREWSENTREADAFLSYLAPDATVYPPGMPLTTGTEAIRKAFTEMSAAPDFSLSWTPTKAEVAASGDIGYTTGTYQMSAAGGAEKGKYVTIWAKQTDGTWKAKEDIFNSDAGQAPAAQHVVVGARDITFGDAPPTLPPGARLAVVAGDPSKPGPFAMRLQFPAGYAVAPHWHPTDEQLTVLSGTFAIGTGDKVDPAAYKDLPVGSYAVLPAKMNHFATARTAATVQINGMGPFVLNCVNPADDPSKKTQ